jgi:hypothetical protein
MLNLFRTQSTEAASLLQAAGAFLAIGCLQDDPVPRTGSGGAASSWVKRELPHGNPLDIVWADSQLVAVGWDGQVLGSPFHPVGVAWTGKEVIMVGGGSMDNANSTITLISTNGMEWRSIRSENMRLRSLCWANGYLAASGDGTDTATGIRFTAAFTSVNGVEWTTVYSSPKPFRGQQRMFRPWFPPGTA